MKLTFPKGRLPSCPLRKTIFMNNAAYKQIFIQVLSKTGSKKRKKSVVFLKELCRK